MHWASVRNRDGKSKNHSVINKLRKEGKITKEFEVLISSLSLENLIAIKLELATRAVNGKLYGLPLWRNLTHITREATLKYAISATKSRAEAMRFLGLTEVENYDLTRRYPVDSFFDEQNIEE